MTKIVFRNPKHSDVVLMDRTSSFVLTEEVLKGLEYTVIDMRRESFYCSFAIIFGVLKRIFSLRRRSLDGVYPERSRRTRDDDGRKHAFQSFRHFLRELYFSYYWVLLDIIRPRVVLTYIENSWVFCRLSQEYKEAAFLAVLNGARWPCDLMAFPELRLSHLFCFGNLEAELYPRYGHKVANFYPIGSLRGDYARRTLPEESPRYDICYISQWVDDIQLGDVDPHGKEAVYKLSEYFARFVKENGAKACIAVRTSSQHEKDYFTKLCEGLDVEFLYQGSPKEQTSYKAMMASKLVLVFHSTMGPEAFGWGKKTLFCNLSEEPLNTCPFYDDLWSMGREPYEVFAKKMHRLLEMDQREYRKLADRVMQTVMAYPSNTSSYEYLREIVLKVKNDRNSWGPTGKIPFALELGK